MAKNADELKKVPSPKKKSPRQRPFWEVAIEIGKNMPDAELEKLPGAMHMEEYLYGDPHHYRCG